MLVPELEALLTPSKELNRRWPQKRNHFRKALSIFSVIFKGRISEKMSLLKQCPRLQRATLTDTVALCG